MDTGKSDNDLLSSHTVQSQSCFRPKQLWYKFNALISTIQNKYILTNTENVCAFNFDLKFCQCKDNAHGKIMQENTYDKLSRFSMLGVQE